MAKRIHMASKVSNTGLVSPLCRDIERPVNLLRESWTNRKEAVDCPYCLKKLAASSKSEVSSLKGV